MDVQLLHERVQLYLTVLVCVDLLFLVTATLMKWLDVPMPMPDAQMRLVEGVRKTVTGLLFASLLYVRFGRPSRRVLVGIESAGTVLLSILYMKVGRYLPEYAAPFTVLMASLALTLRAAVVPSTVTRTLVVGGLAVTATGLAPRRSVMDTRNPRGSQLIVRSRGDG